MEWMKMVLITQAAMPAGIFAIVIVGNYKADLETAMRTILVTMITALITMQFGWYWGASYCLINHCYLRNLLWLPNFRKYL